ncbi:DNA-processing protein DprA [Qingshengfaniella alkalisoli]|uniref:DNA-protecting protein DprA n=1 Tax=Qingshengfaniella alkalisoli TaxID=2599296 RepID=A0A5B8I8W4_9RHOB|nr:DNA-processing protein DprA [Qingshengfaniella alkalisoli]QDY70279.1 DNA-protecting protein DprA [Qingshengfaniella alkalisoli]
MREELFSSNFTPLTPPETDEDRLSWLRLYRSRKVGPATFFRLMHEHGSATAAIDALPEIARAAQIKDYSPASEVDIETEYNRGQKRGATLICFGEPDYPESLAKIDDAPPILWAIGDKGILSRPMISMVGARNASGLGDRMARQLAAELGEAGYIVVSGLARGIDASAHWGALPTGTLAVLGGGVDVLYPAENRELFDRIGISGLRLSEQPIGLKPHARHFPPRNRLISGLAQGLVVVEAAARSGSLITARNALDQGREVMAVPAHPFDGRGTGCNMLLRDGARLIRNAADVIEALGAQDDPPGPAYCPLPRTDWRSQARVALDRIKSGGHPQGPRTTSTKQKAQRRASADDLQSTILARLGPTPLAEDQLIRDLKQPAQIVSPVLLDLELDGMIIRHAGGMISLGETAYSSDQH